MVVVNGSGNSIDESSELGRGRYISRKGEVRVKKTNGNIGLGKWSGQG